jgi:hypothetical protein
LKADGRSGVDVVAVVVVVVVVVAAAVDLN